MSFSYQYIAHFSDLCYSSFSLKDCDLTIASYSIHIFLFILCFISFYFFIAYLRISKFKFDQSIKGQIRFWFSSYLGFFFKICKSLATFPDLWTSEYYLNSISGLAWSLSYLIVSSQFIDILTISLIPFGKFYQYFTNFIEILVLFSSIFIFLIAFSPYQDLLWDNTILTIFSYFNNFINYISLFIFVFTGQLTFVFNQKINDYLPKKPILYIKISLLTTSFFTFILISYFVCSNIMMLPLHLWAEFDYKNRRNIYLTFIYFLTSISTYSLTFLALMMFLLSKSLEESSDTNAILKMPLSEYTF